MKRLKAQGVNIVIVFLLFGFGAYLTHVDNVRRADRRAAFIHSDLRICEEINGIKSALRDKEKESYRHRFRDLKLLHVPATAKVLVLIQDRHERELARFRATNCKQLPST